MRNLAERRWRQPQTRAHPTRSDGGYVIEDTQSANGTFVAGQRVESASCETAISSSSVLRRCFAIRSQTRVRSSCSRQLYEASVTDALTGANNREHFDSQLRMELSYARRHNTDLALVLFDVDHFKRVNDTYGHPVGDEVLIEIARAVRRLVRNEDVFARYGGRGIRADFARNRHRGRALRRRTPALPGRKAHRRVRPRTRAGDDQRRLRVVFDDPRSLDRSPRSDGGSSPVRRQERGKKSRRRERLSAQRVCQAVPYFWRDLCSESERPMRMQFKLDPLLSALLASLALSPAAGCGGSSERRQPGRSGRLERRHARRLRQSDRDGRERLGELQRPLFTPRNRRILRSLRAAHRGLPGLQRRRLCEPTVRPLLVRARWGDRLDGDLHSWLVSDADCASGEICFCEAPVGRCIPALDCAVDADCGSNAFCSTYVGPPQPACGFYVDGAACQKQSDACVGNECNCAMVGGERACLNGLGGCGRPFLVAGVERTADPEQRGDWVRVTQRPERLASSRRACALGSRNIGHTRDCSSTRRSRRSRVSRSSSLRSGHPPRSSRTRRKPWPTRHVTPSSALRSRARTEVLPSARVPSPLGTA